MSVNHPAVQSYNNASLQSRRPDIPWLWEGMLAYNAVTLLSAPEKTGKTTLLSLLLDRRRGGGQLLGRTVQAGRTVLCSEEAATLWALRQPPLDFGDELEFCRPVGIPSPRGWRRFIRLVLEAEQDHAILLVIDTAMHFLPAAENNPRGLRKALDELRMVMSYAQAGVLLLHQTPGARGRSRARGPLRAFADILIDMERPPADRFTRRRRFYGVGRYPGTLPQVTAELNAEGTDYLLLPDGPAELAAPPILTTVQQVLASCPEPLTRQEILDHWPEGEPRPRADSLWRWLNRGCELSMLVRTGAGNKTEAFRYGRGAGQANACNPGFEGPLEEL